MKLWNKHCYPQISFDEGNERRVSFMGILLAQGGFVIKICAICVLLITLTACLGMLNGIIPPESFEKIALFVLCFPR